MLLECRSTANRTTGGSAFPKLTRELITEKSSYPRKLTRNQIGCLRSRSVFNMLDPMLAITHLVAVCSSTCILMGPLADLVRNSCTRPANRLPSPILHIGYSAFGHVGLYTLYTPLHLFLRTRIVDSITTESSNETLTSAPLHQKTRLNYNERAGAVKSQR